MSGAVLTAENLGNDPRCCAPNSLLARFSYLDVWRGAGSSAEIETAVIVYQLCEPFLDHLPTHISKAEIAALETVGQFFVLQT